MVMELNNDSFQAEVLKAEGNALVDFWAPWCGPCRMMAPILEEVSAKLPEVKFAKINTDEYQEIAGQYNITGIPCMILFKDGNEIARFVGAQPAEALEKQIKAKI